MKHEPFSVSRFLLPLFATAVARSSLSGATLQRCYRLPETRHAAEKLGSTDTRLSVKVELEGGRARHPPALLHRRSSSFQGAPLVAWLVVTRTPQA